MIKNEHFHPTSEHFFQVGFPPIEIRLKELVTHKMTGCMIKNAAFFLQSGRLV